MAASPMSAQQLVQILRSGVGARRRDVITQLFSLTAVEMRGVIATCRVDGRSPSRRPWDAREYELLRDALYNHYIKRGSDDLLLDFTGRSYTTVEAGITLPCSQFIGLTSEAPDDCGEDIEHEAIMILIGTTQTAPIPLPSLNQSLNPSDRLISVYATIPTRYYAGEPLDSENDSLEPPDLVTMNLISHRGVFKPDPISVQMCPIDKCVLLQGLARFREDLNQANGPFRQWVLDEIRKYVTLDTDHLDIAEDRSEDGDEMNENQA